MDWLDGQNEASKIKLCTLCLKNTKQKGRWRHVSYYGISSNRVSIIKQHLELNSNRSSILNKFRAIKCNLI